METADLDPLLEELDDNIDDLEEALAPLLNKALSETAGKLPLLDKAHLYVLVTYAIESLLFSCLRLNGVNAKEHPVFRELTRVKQYFEKLKTAQTPGKTPNLRLDKAATGRIIKHALAGNETKDAVSTPQQPVPKQAPGVTREKTHQKPSTSQIGTSPSQPSSEKSNSDSANLVGHVSDRTTPGKVSVARTDEIKVGVSKKRKKGRSHGSDPATAAQATDGESKQERKKRKKLRKELKSQKQSQKVQDGA